ncbi:protein phosphatase PTC1, partial [Phenoliferia sp. Uapishka_3]
MQRQESSKDAMTREETEASTSETFGVLNQHPSAANAFKVGVACDQNRKSRRSMEDAHSFVYDFGGIRGQGYFAVFDGHAGKACAEWCGEHFHEHLLEALLKSPSTPIPDVLNDTFHAVDAKLSQLAIAGGTHSGCTAVTAFLRLEDEDGKPVGTGGGVGSGVAITSGTPPLEIAAVEGEEKEGKEGSARARFGEKVKGLFNGRSSPTSSEPEKVEVTAPVVSVNGPAEVKKAAKRTLYTANAGDARAVLCRGGKAVRLTYDHKGSDAKEAKRITDAGGFVMNNRVNGVLAVTRSLGDSSMKEFVVGSPYTTETTLGPDDEFLIIACDGVSPFLPLNARYQL